MASEAGPAIAVDHGAGPNFQAVQEMDRVFRCAMDNRDNVVVVTCKAWLEGLKGHWRREGMHKDWVESVGFTTYSPNSVSWYDAADTASIDVVGCVETCSDAPSLASELE